MLRVRFPLIMTSLDYNFSMLLIMWDDDELTVNYKDTSLKYYSPKTIVIINCSKRKPRGTSHVAL